MAINTVTGTVEASNLGFTLIHEHLAAGWPGWEFDMHGFDRKGAVAGAIEKLREIKQLGVTSFVDPCPMELGRDPTFAAEVADQTGMNVIMATGLYNDALGIPVHFRMMDIDGIAEIYERELTEGMLNTGIKAGIIKTAVGGIPGITPEGQGITANEEKTLRAAARAHKATGAPILCHNDEFSPGGREILDIFQDEGVDFNRVLIGHADGVGDLRYYFDILDRGAWLGFDRFGIEAICSDKLRLAGLFGLLAVGYDRIMLSQDAVHCWFGRGGEAIQRLMNSSPNWNYSHVCKHIIPTLRQGGVTQEKIDTMMIHNPRAYFGG